MRKAFLVEEYRILDGEKGSNPHSPYGAFMVPFRSHILQVIADDGQLYGWEHVSVSLPNRCPNWDEMCFVKSAFWEDEETVLEFHPKRSEYVSIHPFCLHLWKKVGIDHELPPGILI